jgi:hypothetical protein
LLLANEITPVCLYRGPGRQQVAEQLPRGLSIELRPLAHVKLGEAHRQRTHSTMYHLVKSIYLHATSKEGTQYLPSYPHLPP